MIVSETNFRYIVRQLLREADAEQEAQKSSVDTKNLRLDMEEGAALSALESPDPKNPNQKIALLVQDNKIKIMFKPEGEEPTEIPVTSDQWHNALGALVTHVMDNGSEAAKKELNVYLSRMYPGLKDDLPALLRRYRGLGIE
tara:strand:+ start:19 stop:444 length:426 start_codon:yes stop_codon:yes gene_type:complete